jgi:hypothetical protein
MFASEYEGEIFSSIPIHLVQFIAAKKPSEFEYLVIFLIGQFSFTFSIHVPQFDADATPLFLGVAFR